MNNHMNCMMEKTVIVQNPFQQLLSLIRVTAEIANKRWFANAAKQQCIVRSGFQGCELLGSKGGGHTLRFVIY